MKLTKRSRPIICEGVRYASITLAAQAHGVAPASVRACCEGHVRRAGGKEFKYAEPTRLEREIYAMQPDEQATKAALRRVYDTF